MYFLVTNSKKPYLDLDLDEPELLLGAGEGVPEAARLLGVEREDRAGLGIFSAICNFSIN